MSVGICVGSVECFVLFVSVSATFVQTAAGMRTFDPVLEYLCFDELLVVILYMWLDMLFFYAEQNPSLQK
jgi:hypothetical protein